MLKLAAVLLAGVSIVAAQESPPPIEEVARQLPPDAHVLAYLVTQPPVWKPASVCYEFCVLNLDGNVFPAYKVGGDVTPPRVLRAPNPHYAEQARTRKYQGTVVLFTVIGPDGLAHDVRVARSLGLGLDEEAVKAVRKWRFRPATKDGKPVAVMVNVEVNFKLD